MKHGKKALLILLAIIFVVFAVGCEKRGETEVAQESADGARTPQEYHFILVNNLATIAHFNPDYEGVEMAIRDIERLTGDKVTWEIVGPSENDIFATVQSMDQAIAKRPDGFMVVCWDAEAMVAPIDKAMDAGIPVVTIDADAPASKRLSYIGTDWYTLGQELAEALLREIDYEGKVALVGVVGADNMETAFQGFRDVAADFPDVTIVATEDDGGSDLEAAKKAAALMQAHPDLAGFAGFDVGAGPGISVAIREAGKEGEVKLVGNDLNSAQIKSLEEGTAQFVLGQRRVFFGYWGVMSLWLHHVTSVEFTENDEAAGIVNIPPRIVTGFLRANPENLELYRSAYEEWDKPKNWR